MDNTAPTTANSGAMPPPANSVEVRTRLVDALRIDLVGPPPGHPFAEEVLPEAPSRWYLTGYLLPSSSKPEDRTDDAAVDELDLNADTGPEDDGTEPERSPSV